MILTDYVYNINQFRIILMASADNPNMSVQPIQTPVQVPLTKFQQLVRKHELNDTVANQLDTVLSTCEIVLVCDDSSSMGAEIVEPGMVRNPNAPKVTRWTELKILACEIIKFTTAINPNGLDIYFFNRPKLEKVTSEQGLQQAFSSGPSGGTPLIGTLRKIYRDKNNLPRGKQLLIVVITDGEQSDGNNEELEDVLRNKGKNVHISMAECTSDESQMDHLDEFDGKIPNFDNTDDYRVERAKIQRLRGQNFKFDYSDYVIKILLATFIKWYFDLDQTGSVTNSRYNSGYSSPYSTTYSSPATTYQTSYLPPMNTYTPSGPVYDSSYNQTTKQKKKNKGCTIM